MTHMNNVRHNVADLRKNCPSCSKINCVSGKFNFIMCWFCEIYYCFKCNDMGKGVKSEDEIMKHLDQSNHKYGN